MSFMKKYFSIAVLCALAVLGLGSCAKDVEEEIVTEQTGVRTVTFSASLADQTKTGLSMKFVPNWINTSLENVHLFETSGSTILEGVDVEMRVPEDRNNEVAYFKADFAEEISIIVNPPSPSGVLTRAADEYTYTGIVAQKVDGKFTVPATQYPDPVSLIDPNADFLVGDTKTTFPESMALKEMDIYFVRPVSVSRLAIMNIEGQKVKTVKITSTDKLTGSAAYENVNFSAGTVAWDNSGSNVITISYGEGKDIPAEATFYAYFISLPGNKNITSVEVTTDQYVYTKSYASGKTLKFDTVEFRNIAVDMSKVTPTPVGPVVEPQTQEITFHKNNGTITSDSFTLGSGTYVLPTLEGVANGATVTWTLTESNPAGVATIAQNGNVWTLTPVKAGTVKVNATASAVEGYKETTVSYTLTVSDAGTQTLAFEPASLTVTLGEDFTEPVLSGAKTSVTYSIDDDTVATIDENTGKLTLVAAGTATVTATAAAGTAEGTYYAQATKNYALTVNEPAAQVTYYKASILETGYDYIIVSGGQALKNNGNGNVVAAVAVEVTDNTITPANTEGLLWTVGDADASVVENGPFTLKNGEQYLYRNGGSSTSTLIGSTTPATARYGVWDYDGEFLSNLSTSSYGTSTYYVYYNNGWVVTTTQNGASIFTARQPQTLSFSAETAEYDLNPEVTFTAPTLSGVETSVTYASSDETVATVAADGTVTALKKGTATITATAASSSQFQGATASYELSVVDTTPGVMATYKKVTSTAGLVAGAKYLLVFEGLAGDTDGDGNPKVFSAELNSDGSQFAKATASALDVTIASSTIESDQFGDCLFTLESGYYLKGDKANKYIYPGTSGSSSVMLAESTASHALTITFDEGIAQIMYRSNSQNRYLVWSTSNHYFSCNTDVSGRYSTGICLYKLDDGTTPTPAEQTIAFTPAAAGYDLYTKAWTPSQPVLGGAQTTVTYESSDPTVASVAADGTITALKAGEVTITAAAAATAEYQAATATCTVTVVDTTPAPSPSTYVKVTSITSGGKYLIVSADSGNYNGQNGTKAFVGDQNGTAVTVTNNSGVITGSYSAYEFVISQSGSAYTLLGPEGYVTGDANTGTRYIKVSQTSGTMSLSMASDFSGSEGLVADAFYFYYTKNNNSKEVLYFNADGQFKIGGTGRKYGVYLYKLDDGTTPEPAAQTIAFTPAAAQYDLYTKAWTPSQPVLGGAETEVTYTSSDPTVATVAANGTITALKVGEVTVTANAAATAAYQAATTTCTVTVVDTTPDTPTTQFYTKINSRDDLPSASQTDATGDYLFVYEAGAKAYVFKAICDGTPTGAGNTSNGHVELTKTGSAIEVVLTENGIAATDAVKACKIQLAHHATATRNDWTIKPASLGTYWVRINNDRTNGVRILAMTSAGYSSTFTFEGSGNNAEIKRTDSSRNAYWTYNATDNCFEATATASKISVYKLSE